jgi:hypothetical protein
LLKLSFSWAVEIKFEKTQSFIRLAIGTKGLQRYWHFPVILEIIIWLYRIEKWINDVIQWLLKEFQGICGTNQTFARGVFRGFGNAG